MRKPMIGDVVIVVIDEIGEVAFMRDPMEPSVIAITKKETCQRVMAATVEMLDFIRGVLPVSVAHFKVCEAMEYLLRDHDYLLDRLTEQVEFNRDVRSG